MDDGSAGERIHSYWLLLGLGIGSPNPWCAPEPSRGARGPTSKANGVTPLIFFLLLFIDINMATELQLKRI